MKETNVKFIKAGFELAATRNASAVLLYIDPLEKTVFDEKWDYNFKLYLITKRKKLDTTEKHRKTIFERATDIITIPKIPVSRTSLAKLALVLGISNEKIKYGDTVVCILGAFDSALLDTILCINTGVETELISGKLALGNICEGISPAVFQAVLNLCIELAEKGREGKPIGTIFVVGDEDKVLGLSKQMIYNPFKGYTEEERNILNAQMKETLREFSTLDGAFIISSDGAVITGGRFLSAAADVTKSKYRFGSRHLAAAGITALTKAIAFVISESTGDVRIFKNGDLIMEFEKSTKRR